MTNPQTQYATLQSIDLNAMSEVEVLHYKFESPKKGFYPLRQENGVLFRQGSTVEFDTLFGTFYESDWYGYTAVENVVLKLRVSGSYAATVYRKTNSGDVYVVGRTESASDDPVFLQFSKSKALPNLPARMWVLIDALTDIIIHEVSWLTPDEAVQKDVSLGVCFTTFNRLPYLKRVINDLLSNDECVGCISKIIIVNQGAAFTLDDLIDARNRDKAAAVRLIKQENFGGCGGFTRGIIEVMGDDELSHVLLCDDDIVFEAHSIVRLTSFIKYCHDDVAVGGQMLDMLRPNFLYESGAVLRESTLLPQPLGHNMFLGDPATLDYLIDSSRVDYNGWWYFAFSKKIVEQVALPIPCFIRGDDIEYGIRLKKHHIHTVVLPGIVVWHEPFYIKLHGWHYYYELKNRLILQALHYRRSIQKDLRRIKHRFVRDLLNCRYHSAKLAILAIEDFVAGPDVSMTCDSGKLAEVKRHVEYYGPSYVIGDYIPEGECPAKSMVIRPMWRKLQESVAFLFDAIALPRRRQKRCYIRYKRFNITNTIGCKEFVVRDMDQSTYLLYRRSWRNFVKLLIEYRRASIRLKKSYPSLVGDYKAAEKSFTSMEHWVSVLKLDAK